MTKQEERREGMAERIYKEAPGWAGYEYVPFKDAPEIVRDQYLRKADERLNYLHSQGKVIKVDGELPIMTGSFVGLSSDEARQVYFHQKAIVELRNAGYVKE